MDKKICTWCKKEKDLNEFVLQTKKRDGRASNCKSCMKEKREQMKDVRNKKRNDKRASDEEYRNILIERNRSWNKNNPDYAKQRYEKDRERMNERTKQWIKKNQVAVNQRSKEREKIKKQNFKNQFSDVIDFQESWNVLQKEFYRIDKNEKAKIKRIEDANYRLSDNMRARIRKALKNQSAKKNKSTMDLVGCTGLELSVYLNNLWYNKETDHIDHIVAISRFDLTNTDHQLVACHYLNLQPLHYKENCSKHDKLPENWQEVIYRICEVRNINPQPIINHIKETVKC